MSPCKRLHCDRADFQPRLGKQYLEAAGVTVDVEVLDGDLGIVTHRLSAVRAEG